MDRRRRRAWPGALSAFPAAPPHPNPPSTAPRTVAPTRPSRSEFTSKTYWNSGYQLMVLADSQSPVLRSRLQAPAGRVEWDPSLARLTQCISIQYTVCTYSTLQATKYRSFGNLFCINSLESGQQAGVRQLRHSSPPAHSAPSFSFIRCLIRMFSWPHHQLVQIPAFHLSLSNFTEFRAKFGNRVTSLLNCAFQQLGWDVIEHKAGENQHSGGLHCVTINVSRALLSRWFRHKCDWIELDHNIKSFKTVPQTSLYPILRLAFKQPPIDSISQDQEF